LYKGIIKNLLILSSVTGPTDLYESHTTIHLHFDYGGLYSTNSFFIFIDRTNLTINDFALACAIDDSGGYFTYQDNTMLIIQSKVHAKLAVNDFKNIEPFIEALISHEVLHVVIKDIEGSSISDCLDDLEVIIEREGMKFQVTLNNMLFAEDMCGLVTK
jgi:membrane protease subunit (stomatin/prohibitin family)